MCYTIHSVDELIQILEQLLKQDKKMFPYNNARIIIGEDVVNDLMYYLNDYNRLIQTTKTIDGLIERIENNTTVIRNAFPYDVAVVTLPKEDFDDFTQYLMRRL